MSTAHNFQQTHFIMFHIHKQNGNRFSVCVFAIFYPSSQLSLDSPLGNHDVFYLILSSFNKILKDYL